jgi:hypothetical protein
MKVIFLDIDGVLNTLDTFVRKKHLHGNVEIDEDRVLRLKEIIDIPKANLNPSCLSISFLENLFIFLFIVLAIFSLLISLL